MPHLTVRQQIDHILEDAHQGPVEVIVRLGGGAGEDMVAAAAEALRRRMPSDSARQVLPGGPGSSADSVAAHAPAPADEAALAAAARELYRDVPAELLGVFWTARAALLRLSRDDLARLPATLPGVVEVHPNRHLPLPPFVEVDEPLQTEADLPASTWGVGRVGALAAWGAYGARGGGATVGLLDTGVDASHPDLNGKLAAWAQFDRLGQPVASEPHDSHRHGTHVAGTIAGGNASGSWIGVAPDATIAAALVLDGEQGGTDAQVLAGFDWAVEQGVDVLSLSLGGLTVGPDTPNTYSQAIVTALGSGIPVVAAIGNAGAGTSGAPGNDLFAFSAGAIDSRDVVAGFSGGRTQIITESDFIDPGLLPLAYTKPDVTAPGVAVRSSVPSGEWAVFSGTSMATPHVSGAVALLLSATDIAEGVPAAERAFLLQDLLAGSAEELGEAGQDYRYGFGRINVLRAIALARQRGH